MPALSDPDRPCRTCGSAVRFHRPCPACGGAIEHHPGAQVPEIEWEGLARMATAGRAAGRPLGNAEVEALRRYPNPRQLTLAGWLAPDDIPRSDRDPRP
jgi:hypothetical protein